MFYGGGLKLFGEQALANGVAIAWSFPLTLLIMFVLKKTMGVRVDESVEQTGLDLALHRETAYHSEVMG